MLALGGDGKGCKKRRRKRRREKIYIYTTYIPVYVHSVEELKYGAEGQGKK